MPQLSPIELDGSLAEENEQDYVHNVYDHIADHFSQTRYKPWPLIERFLNSLQSGSIGLDSGTGNGKYIPINQGGRIHMIGLDRSLNLLKIARGAGGIDRDVVLGDALGLGWRRRTFDFAISIATIHHLSTPERRCEAIKVPIEKCLSFVHFSCLPENIQSLIQCLNPDSGRLLIYVWAVEQDELSKRVVPEALNTGRASPTTGKPQDFLVPWVRTIAKSKAEDSTGVSKVYQRYYHFFSASELSDLFCRAAAELDITVGPVGQKLDSSKESFGAEIVNTGWERSNYYLEARMWRRATS